MKKVSKGYLLFATAGALFISCNRGNHTANTEATNDTTADTSTPLQMDYPYTIEQPDNWGSGSRQNTFNALSALKAWENGNITESLKYFADSVRVQFDAIDRKGPKDTLKAIITPTKAQKSVKIKMEDSESVISKDKKSEYVTLWYRQYEEDAKGRKDSVDIINDLKMKDGKIIGLAEYRRKLH